MAILMQLREARKQYIRSLSVTRDLSPHTIRAWVRKLNLQKPLGSWTKGATPWNKGQKYRAGWHHTPETRAALALQKTGEKNPQWRDGITKQAMMQVVNDLEGMGHVKRSPDPKDARAKIVALTAKGQKERIEAGKAVASAEQKIRRKLGVATYDALRETLAAISGA